MGITVRDRYLAAWRKHDDYGVGLTKRYQDLIDEFNRTCQRDENGRPIGIPRKPPISINEGVHVSEQLTEAEQAYAKSIGWPWPYIGSYRLKLRREGYFHYEILDLIEKIHPIPIPIVGRLTCTNQRSYLEAHPLKKTDCPKCMKLLDSFSDIPETLTRTRAVWATQFCTGRHDLDTWLQWPT